MRLPKFLRPRASLSTSSELYKAFLANGWTSTAKSGVNVTVDNALANTVVLACLIVRAETFGSLPVHVYKKTGDRRLQIDDSVSRLLSDEPNPLMDAGEFWRWEQLSEDIYGNAYVRVERRGTRPIALWPLFGEMGPLKTEAGRMVYDYKGDVTTPTGALSGDDVIHFKGPILRNPYEGKSLIELAKETIGLSIGSEEFFSRLLANGSHFPGHLETDNALRQEDITALAEQFESMAGIAHAGKLRIFDRGLKLVQNDMTIKDTDLTNQQRYQLERIASIFRVPVALIMDNENSTYTNAEQFDLWLEKHCIRPLAVSKERAIRRKLLTDDQYVRFSLDGLRRGEYRTRSEAYSLLVTSGILSPNEARAYEELDPYDGGDEHRVPLNTEPAGLAEQAEPENRAIAALGVVLDDATQRIAARAKDDASRGRDRAQTVEYAGKVLAPVAQAYAAAGEDFDPDTHIAGLLEV